MVFKDLGLALKHFMKELEKRKMYRKEYNEFKKYFNEYTKENPEILI
jgi:hypothetical protein